jgi:hypothetical protein
LFGSLNVARAGVEPLTTEQLLQLSTTNLTGSELLALNHSSLKAFKVRAPLPALRVALN